MKAAEYMPKAEGTEYDRKFRMKIAEVYFELNRMTDAKSVLESIQDHD